MSERDTVRAIIEEIGSILEADEDLLEIIKNDDEEEGELRYHHLWAPPDCKFPYFTITVGIRAESDESNYQVANIQLNIWDADPSSGRVLDARGRIMRLLHRRVIECDEFNGRSWFVSDDDLPEPEQEVWSRPIMWTMRLYPIAEVADIKARA